MLEVKAELKDNDKNTEETNESKMIKETNPNNEDPKVE